MRLATSRRTTLATATPARPRRLEPRAVGRTMLGTLVTRDDDEHGAAFDLGAGRGRDAGDAAGRGCAQLVLHLHRLEGRERRVAFDPVAFGDVHRLQQSGHRRADLDPAGPRGARRTRGALRPLVDDARANENAVDV